MFSVENFPSKISIMEEDDDKSLSLTSGIPDFIVKLYKMLMETSDDVVCWSESGTSFVIKDISEFTKNLLPLNFKHGNFASFVRQLNKYDFHKVKSVDSRKFGGQAWEFSHLHFAKDQPQFLSQIKRKIPGKPDRKNVSPETFLSSPVIQSVSEVSALKSQLGYMESLQKDMSSHLKHLAIQYQNILDQVSGLRHTISIQEQVIRSLIEYIPNDKKQFLHQSLSNTFNGSLFPSVSMQAIPVRPSNLESNGNNYQVQEDRSNFNISFHPVNPNLVIQTKPFELVPQDLGKKKAAFTTSSGIANSTIQLPITPLSASMPSFSTPSWSAPPKVLLVEDDDTCRRLSSKLLQLFGCKFDIAVDGLDAVNRMNIGCKYDLVLMDIMMPNLDGVSATTIIRQFDQFTPIISMTSNITENDCSTYLANGMNDILVKPFNKSTLLGMIQRHYIRSNGETKNDKFPIALMDQQERITDVSGDKCETLNVSQLDSQLYGLMQMEPSIPQHDPPSDESQESKRQKRSNDCAANS